MITSSLFDITLALDDPNIVKALTLNILTFGYDMDEGSKPLAIIYHIYYKLLNTQLNPCARLRDSGDKTLLIQCSTPNAKVQVPKMIQWKDINLPKEWLLEREAQSAKFVSNESNLDHIQQYLDGTVKISSDDNRPLMIKEARHFFARFAISEDISKRDQDLKFLQKNFEKLDLKLKGVVSDNSQVSTVYYSTKTNPPSKLGKHVIEEEEEETKSGSPTAFDFQALTAIDFQTPIIQSQLRVLNKVFVIDMVALFDEFKSAKNKNKNK